MAKDVRIARASDVEYERLWLEGKSYSGWTVRAHHQPEYVYLSRTPTDGKIIVVKNGVGLPAMFATREEALKEEVEHFWELLPPEGR